jgi:capsular polysaccharide export protein
MEKLPPLLVPPRLRSTWRFGRVPLIEPLLGARIVPREWPLAQVDGVIGWGRKLTGQRALALARRTGLPWLLAEDGFLRSVGLGDREAALSIVLDDIGIYYDARTPSRLEALISAGHTAPEQSRAHALAAAWRSARVSKYNHARERPGLLAPGDVLVVDQTVGDSSISCGLADATSFRHMLEAALDEHPRARIVLKVHPDVVAGRKRSHFDGLTDGQAARVLLLAADAHPPPLFEAAAVVYCVTSQMGFEALLWGRPVRCFGMPFYAGWGLTADSIAPPPRRAGASLESLVHASLVDYPRYLDPETRQRCEPERLLEWMALQRRQRERFPDQVRLVGYRHWRRPLVRAFLAGSTPGVERGPVVHVQPGLLAPPHGRADALHSRSWLMDSHGDPHDGNQRSDLETLLACHPFDAELLARACRLRERLAAAPLPAPPAGSVLVIGSAGADTAALLRRVHAELPDARLAFLPAVGNGVPPGVVDTLLSPDQPWRELLGHAASVHVQQSPLGFLALLLGLPVTCHGVPFYAGWGLTEDRVAAPAGRGRKLTLDALVAAALILYPAYLSRTSGRFTTPERVLDEADDPAAALPSSGTLLAHDVLQRLAGGWLRLRRR